MRIRVAKITLLSHESVILGLVFVLLILVLFCGPIQIANHSVGTEGAECSRSLLLANYIPSKDSGLFLSILFFSFVALALLIKSSTGFRQSSGILFRPSPAFLKVAEAIPKLYNPILEALRRGILEPQIYNLALISS